jgi:hypothetical protein
MCSYAFLCLLCAYVVKKQKKPFVRLSDIPACGRQALSFLCGKKKERMECIINTRHTFCQKMFYICNAY